MAIRFISPLFTRLDVNGNPVSGAQMFFYESGTTTKLDTFSDEALTIPNANPVVADSAGEFPDIWLKQQDYKVILTSATDTDPPTGGTTFDPVQGQLDLAGDDFKATPQSPADMTVLVSAGSLYDVVSKTLVVKTAQTSALIVAPTTNPRKDIIYIDRLTGVIGIETGAEAGSPVDPTISDDKLPVARVTLAIATTEITDSLITDIRELNLLGAGDVVRYSFVDEDDMASDSAVLIPSQQSVKAFVDAFPPDASKAPPEMSNGTDADHDIDIPAGYCRADNAAVRITNIALVKQFDAPWALGTAAGGNDQAQLDGAQTVTFSTSAVTIDASTWPYTPVAGDTLIVVGGLNDGISTQVTAGTTTVITGTGTPFSVDAASASAIYVVKANTSYHEYTIRRSDTGAVDALFSEGAVAPDNLPANYDQYRRIGGVRTDGTANIIPFFQHDDRFIQDVPVQDYSENDPGTAAVTRTLSVLTGIPVTAIHVFQTLDISAASAYALITALEQTDSVPSATLYHTGTFSTGEPSLWVKVRTNASGQVRTRISVSTASITLKGLTVGWIDHRGRNA